MIQDFADSLSELVRTVKARAWEEGYRHTRGPVAQEQVDLHNPYVQKAGHVDG